MTKINLTVEQQQVVPPLHQVTANLQCSRLRINPVLRPAIGYYQRQGSRSGKVPAF